MTNSAASHRTWLVFLRIVMLALLVITMVRFAWLSDDSLITIRTALNHAHGWGTGFNVDERVQAYTHPLWYLVILAVGWATNSWIIAPMLIGICLTTAAVALVLWRVQNWALVLLAGSALVLSNSVIEYGTSGLEGSLAYLLVALATIQTARSSRALSNARAALLGVTVAGLVLTRHDLAILVLPVGMLLIWQLRRQLSVLAAFLVALVLPVLIWSLFAFTQFGSILPNTFVSKTNLELPVDQVLASGVRYAFASAAFDPVGLLVLLVGVVLVVLIGSRWMITWAIGIIGYLAYVVVVGGDFMAGRFWAVPIFTMVSVLAVYSWRRPLVDADARTPTAAQAAIGAVAALVLISWGRADALLPSVPSEPRWDLETRGGVSDEFGWYSPSHTLTGFLSGQRISREGQDPEMGPSALVIADERARDWADATSLPDPMPVSALPCGSLGISSILSGPTTHWVDQCALADAFIAGLPFTADRPNWRVGHYIRELPDGYLDALATGDASRIADPVLAARLSSLWARIRS